MAALSTNQIFVSIFLTVFFYRPSESVKCFHCNSANNSACLDLNLQRMHAIVPVVDCARSLPVPGALATDGFFCRKITQTILHIDKTPEVRITRGCGWVKHKRECYTNDNKDHLETVCQCFGDMCNGATAHNLQLSAVAAAAILVLSRTWQGI